MSLSLSSYIARKQQAAAPAQQAAPLASGPDASVLQAWNITEAAWAVMTDQQRTWHRWNITKAPGFSA